MLSINGKPRDVTHAETGARFKIRFLTPEKYQALQAQSQKKAEKGVDPVLMAGNVAKFAILEWNGIGEDGVPDECDDEHKLAFGKTFAFDIMPWLTNEAMSLAGHMKDEAEEGKND